MKKINFFKMVLSFGFILIALLTIIAPVCLFGQESIPVGEVEENEEIPFEGRTLFDLIKSGGLIGFFLILTLSLISPALIIVNIINLVLASRYWSRIPEQRITTNDIIIRQNNFEIHLLWPKILKAIGIIAFLLGFLGTTVGGIRAFTVIEMQESPSPAMLAHGIYGSLVTLTEGVLIAIFLFLLYYFFRLILFIIEHNGQKKWQKLGEKGDAKLI